MPRKSIEPNERLEQLLKQLIEQVEILTKVASIQVAPEKSITERARVLKMAGLDNQTIADILNTSQATIRTLTSNLRGQRRSS
jgi:DNA-binding CsgD family transcriptional regulator